LKNPHGDNAIFEKGGTESIFDDGVSSEKNGIRLGIPAINARPIVLFCNFVVIQRIFIGASFLYAALDGKNENNGEKQKERLFH
jgi:hypothetical protein